MVQGGRPKTTVNAEALCASDDVDVVLICNADEYHVSHGILALKYNKWALIEKPLALCFQGIDSLIDAEKESTGKIFVGTMRRFAPAFLEAVQEVKKYGQDSLRASARNHRTEFEFHRSVGHVPPTIHRCQTRRCG
jgi:predicted dehydrogenase